MFSRRWSSYFESLSLPCSSSSPSQSASEAEGDRVWYSGWFSVFMSSSFIPVKHQSCQSLMEHTRTQQNTTNYHSMKMMTSIMDCDILVRVMVIHQVKRSFQSLCFRHGSWLRLPGQSRCFVQLLGLGHNVLSPSILFPCGIQYTSIHKCTHQGTWYIKHNSTQQHTTAHNSTVHNNTQQHTTTHNSTQQYTTEHTCNFLGLWACWRPSASLLFWLWAFLTCKFLCPSRFPWDLALMRWRPTWSSNWLQLHRRRSISVHKRTQEDTEHIVHIVQIVHQHTITTVYLAIRTFKQSLKWCLAPDPLFTSMLHHCSEQGCWLLDQCHWVEMDWIAWNHAVHISIPQNTINTHQHTSAHISTHQYTSAHISTHQHTPCTSSLV